MDTSQKCLNCGSGELFSKPSAFTGNHHSRLFPGLTGFLKPSVKATTYICAQCGYIMFFVTQEELIEVKEAWEPADETQ